MYICGMKTIAMNLNAEKAKKYPSWHGFCGGGHIRALVCDSAINVPKKYFLFPFANVHEGLMAFPLNIRFETLE